LIESYGLHRVIGFERLDRFRWKEMNLLREKCQTASPVGWDFVDDLSTTRSTFPTVPFKSLADDVLSLNLNYSTFEFLHNWLVDFEGLAIVSVLL